MSGRKRHISLDKMRKICYNYRQNLAVLVGILLLLPLYYLSPHSAQNSDTMLTINVSHDAQGALRYFKESLVKEGNYYLDQEVKAYWQGITSKYLGLQDQEVTEHDFGKLAANRHHETDEQLTPRNASNRRSTIDWTFSAPKSVSIAYALTKDEQILVAHQKAYRVAMEKVEAMMYTQNNSRYARGYTHTGNIIYAAFDHELARPVEVDKNGKTLWVADPQLHSHCVQMNVTCNSNTSRYEALEILNAHTHSAYVSAAYHSALSLELEKVGYQTERTLENFELHGIGRDMIDRFSTRTQQIEKIAREKGLDAKAKGELGAKTRAHKSELSLSNEELERHWKDRLSDEEYNQVLTLKGQSFERTKRISSCEAIDRSLDHFLERNSVVNEKKVIAHAASLGYGHLSIEDVTKELQSRKNILRSERDTISMITTREMVREEDLMIDLATSGKGKFPALNKDFVPKQEFLNQDQRKCISDILSSYDQTMIISGKAGVGKTTTLACIRDGLAQSGKSIFAVAPSSQATEVLREKGFEADTIAALLNQPQIRERLQNNVLLVDEVGMCGVKSMSQILQIGKQYNARILLSGDTKQHGPPAQYGDALRILEKQSGLKVSTISKIMRQQPEQYRSAVQDLSNGKILTGYQKLDQQGSVVEVADHEERIDRLADDYVEALTQKHSALIISPTHAEGDQINLAVIQKLKQKGRIQGEEKVFDTLKDLSLTDAQKQDVINYQAGQVIRFTKNQKGGFKAGSHHEVVGISKEQQVKVRDLKTGAVAHLPNKSPEYYSVHQKQSITLAKGTTIRLTNNTVSLQGTKMNNGTSYEVKGFTKGGIELSNGKTVPNDLYHMRYGYCQTSHSSQGKDAHSIFISMSDQSQGGINDQSFYVSVSRGTKEVSIYCSDKEELKKSIIRSGERLSAREVAADHQRQSLARKQRSHYQKSNEKNLGHERVQGRQKIPSGGVPKEFTGR